MAAFEALVVVSSVLAGLIGGVFFAFSVFVMRALAQLPPASGIAAMQRINVTVINPLFLGPFLGTALALLALATYLASLSGGRHSTTWLLVGFLVYTLGAVGVTVAMNVPRNNKLAAMQPTSQAAESYWPSYVREWMLWNHVRCAASLVSAAASALALPAG